MKHKTKEGIELEISEMDDKHLFNTINFLLNKLELAKNILENNFVFIMNDKEEEVEEAKYFIHNFNSKLMYYIFEAWKRGLEMSSLRDKYVHITKCNIKLSNFFNNDNHNDNDDDNSIIPFILQ